MEIIRIFPIALDTESYSFSHLIDTCGDRKKEGMEEERDWEEGREEI